VKNLQVGFHTWISATGAVLAQVVLAPVAIAQTAPSIPAEQLAGPGQTVTINVSNGSRATLSVGTSNAFGVTTNMSGMAGTTIESKSALQPLEGKISTVLGASSEEGGTPSISADIKNIRTVGGGSSDFTSAGGTTGSVESVDSAQFAEGSTTLSGMSSAFDMTLDPDATSFTTSLNNPGNAGDAATNVSNASAAANVNSNINVDISNTSFSSAFSQNF
jgi:hypothetical protein